MNQVTAPASTPHDAGHDAAMNKRADRVLVETPLQHQNDRRRHQDASAPEVEITPTPKRRG